MDKETSESHSKVKNFEGANVEWNFPRSKTYEKFTFTCLLGVLKQCCTLSSYNICVEPRLHHVLGLCRWNPSGYFDKVIPTYTMVEPQETVGQTKSLLHFICTFSIWLYFHIFI